MFPGRLFCRRPVLTDPASPPRCALRPDPPVVCSGFGLDKSLRCGCVGAHAQALSLRSFLVSSNFDKPLIDKCEDNTFPDKPCMKSVYRDKKALVHWSAANNNFLFRPGDKPDTHRTQTARQPLVVFPHRFQLDFACSCFWKEVQAMCFPCFGGYEGRLSPGRTVLSAPSPARPPPPHNAPRTGPLGVCPGFGFDI